MKKEISNHISKKFSVNSENYMESLRHNLDLCISETDLTIKSLAEEADIPFSTLNNILYADLTDCKVSTVVRLARALNLTLDELIGCGTLKREEQAALSATRNLPEHSRYLIAWFIQRQMELQNARSNESEKVIPVMRLLKDNLGNLRPTNEFDALDISHIANTMRSKIFLGIRLRCDRYMPRYSPYDILLIANDRPPLTHEDSVLIYGGNLYIAKRRTSGEDSRQAAKYYSIRDNKYRVNENRVDNVMGYIADVITT